MGKKYTGSFLVHNVLGALIKEYPFRAGFVAPDVIAKMLLKVLRPLEDPDAEDVCIFLVSVDGQPYPLGARGVHTLAAFLSDMETLPEGMVRGPIVEHPAVKEWMYLLVVPEQVRFSDVSVGHDKLDHAGALSFSLTGCCTRRSTDEQLQTLSYRTLQDALGMDLFDITFLLKVYTLLQGQRAQQPISTTGPAVASAAAQRIVGEPPRPAPRASQV